MKTHLIPSMAALAVVSALAVSPQAMAADAAAMQKILQEVQALKKSYEARTAQLEKKLKQLQENQSKTSTKAPTSPVLRDARSRTTLSTPRLAWS